VKKYLPQYYLTSISGMRSIRETAIFLGVKLPISFPHCTGQALDRTQPVMVRQAKNEVDTFTAYP
jgi:hypothetical protein